MESLVIGSKTLLFIALFPLSFFHIPFRRGYTSMRQTNTRSIVDCLYRTRLEHFAAVYSLTFGEGVPSLKRSPGSIE